MCLRNALIAGFLLTVTAGCSEGPQNTVEGPEGQSITLTVPNKKVEITQGKQTEFSVTATRKKLEGPVKIKFELPEGLKIEEPESEWTIAENQKIFTLQAAESIKPQEKPVIVRVTATHKDMKKPAAANLEVRIKESLKSKQKRQAAFVEKLKAKFTQIKNDLKTAQKKVMSEVKDDAKKADFLKRIGELYEESDRTDEKFKDDIVNASVEAWERNREEVSEGVDELANSTSKLLNELNSLNKDT